MMKNFFLTCATLLLAMGLAQAEQIDVNTPKADSQLDPHRFMRVNRQYIVNAAAVEKASIYFLGKMRIHMKSYPDVEIIVSKDKVATVKRWLNS